MQEFFRWLYHRPFGLSWFEYARFRAIFDPVYYRETQPDVAAVGIDPAAHYVATGWLEARDPSEDFDTIWYLHAHPEAARSGLNPLIHYVRFGHAAGLSCKPTAADGDDWRSRAERNPDLPESLRNHLADYVLLAGSDQFDRDFVRTTYDIGRADPIAFFLRYGNARSLDPNASFSSAAYLDLNRDVRVAGLLPFVHYLRHGALERRSLVAGLGRERPAAEWRDGVYLGLDEAQRQALADRVAALGAEAPLISVVVPVYATDPAYLNACIRSVRDGAYRKFELILVDDASPGEVVRECLRQAAEADDRIRSILREKNGNISAATNQGVAAATGDFVAFLDHDDELMPDTLLCVAEAIVAHPQTDVWYTDQLKCDASGRVFDHFYKPDWSPIYALGVMYVGHLLTVRRSLVQAVGGFDSGFDGVQDYEFLLRLSEHTAAIGHIPRALYEWRAIEGSLAAGVAEKSGIEEKQRRAVEAHLARAGRSWVARSHPRLPHRLLLEAGPRTPTPGVSIVIPSRDQGLIVERCLDSLFGITDYPSFRVIVVDNGTTDPVALAAFARHRVEVVDFDRPFNFSQACNLGAAAADGDLLVFLNNDTEIIESRWLRDLAAFLEDPAIGAVGPTLLYPDRTVQHAGVVLGARGTADHVMRFFPEQVDGYAGSLPCARDVSAVTAACLMMPRRLFEEIGRFSQDYGKHYQDVDLCLRLRERGKTIVSVGNVRLIHHESVSRRADGYDLGDRALLIDRWYETIAAGDPFFNRHFDLAKLDYRLA